MARLGASKQELHVLRRELVDGRLVAIDSSVDHVRLLLLQHDHAGLDGVFDAQAGDDAGAALTDAVAAVVTSAVV